MLSDLSIIRIVFSITCVILWISLSEASGLNDTSNLTTKKAKTDQLVVPKELKQLKIVHLIIHPESNQIHIHTEPFYPYKEARKLESFIDPVGNLLEDHAKFKQFVSSIKSQIVLLKATLNEKSSMRINCYQDRLVRLLSQQLNCSLIMVGELSACHGISTLANFGSKQDKSKTRNPANFLLTIPESIYKLVYRDLVKADMQVWKEALVIYDSSDSFSRYQLAFENLNMKLHIYNWRSDQTKKNMEIINSFARIRTFVVDMSVENVKQFFSVADELEILVSMMTNVIVIDSTCTMSSLEELKYPTANITLIRPTFILYNESGYADTTTDFNKIPGKTFYDKMLSKFIEELRRTLIKMKSDVVKSFKSNNFLPSIWTKEFNESATNQLIFQASQNDDYPVKLNFEAITLTDKFKTKMAYWDTNKGFLQIPYQNLGIDDPRLRQIYNKTFRVTTMEDPPFVMYRERNDNGDLLTGNDRYHGMAIDLLKALAEMKRFKYIIHTVGDGTFGTKNETTGEWNGMIGELINNKADMVVASFTITYDRERVIDFTTPWMSLGLSIVIKKAKSQNESLQFLAPLSQNVWLMMIGAYVVVSSVLCIVGRLTPYEWYIKFPCNNKIENQFSFLNSFWFTVGSLMQQGCEISPRATSTRMISTIWWFFILIMISSYTANLAAFLTIERLQTAFNSVEELSRQTKVKYGTLYGGSTYSFFKNSNISTYRRMWKFMNSNQDVFVDSTLKGIERVRKGDYAFVLESTLNEYYTRRDCSLMALGGLLDSRGYAIGLSSGNNVLRDILSEGILRLQKDQKLETFRQKWMNRYNLTKQCYEHNSHSNTVRNQLGLDKMAGAFYGLLIGLAASLIITFVELFVWSVKKAPGKNQTIYESIEKQVKLAACHCHRFKPMEYDINNPSLSPMTISHDSPLLLSTSPRNKNKATNYLQKYLQSQQLDDEEIKSIITHRANIQPIHLHHHHHHNLSCTKTSDSSVSSSCPLTHPTDNLGLPNNSRSAATMDTGPNTIKAGSATITIPHINSYDEHHLMKLQKMYRDEQRPGEYSNMDTPSPDLLHRPLPLERALLMKYNSTENLRYSCYFNNIIGSPNGMLPTKNPHKITSL